MAGSVAYGVRYGKKHSQKMEENYAQYEVKPKAEAEIEVTPEMSDRQKWVRQRMGCSKVLGSHLCFLLSLLM